MTDSQFEVIRGLLAQIVDLLENMDKTSSYAVEQQELSLHSPGCKCGYH